MKRFILSVTGPPALPVRNELAGLWVAAWSSVIPDIDFNARRGWLITRFEEWPMTITISETSTSSRIAVAGFALLDPGRGHLDQIAVHPDLFGSSAASCLMEAAKKQCPGGMTLEVNKQNPRAIRFYERKGFVAMGESTNPASGLPTLMMRWETSA